MLTLKSLKRDAGVVLGKLRVEENHEVYAREDCAYYIPKTLAGSKVLRLDTDPMEVSLHGMLVVGKTYMVFNAATMVKLGPCVHETVEVDGVPCIVFHFEKGDLVFKSLQVPVMNKFGYNLTKELTKKACPLPWYKEGDRLNIPLTLPEFTGTALNDGPYLNLYTSYFLRDPEDLTQEYRLSGRKKDPMAIPLNAVGLTVPSTMNALGGSYMDDAMQAKLVKPSEKSSGLEEVLR